MRADQPSIIIKTLNTKDKLIKSHKLLTKDKANKLQSTKQHDQSAVSLARSKSLNSNNLNKQQKLKILTKNIMTKKHSELIIPNKAKTQAQEREMDPIMQMVSKPIKQEPLYNNNAEHDREYHKPINYFEDTASILNMYNKYVMNNYTPINITTEPDNVVECLIDAK